ncbi:MAG: MATE family efflux transporter [Lachnospiraceae bacterium]|nr:MATE family efflux transporter [Lachnospiraceae bacterium]
MEHKLFDREPLFYKNVFTLALPIALQSLITIGVNMLDTIMVGSLSEEALSATSLANSFISIYQIFCMGLGMGASVLVSRYYGMKMSNEDTDKASHALKQTVCLMLRLTIALATLFALVTAIMPGTIMRMYTNEEPIIALGTDYFRWSVVTYLFLGPSLTSTIALRSVRQVKLPLLVSIGALFVNLGANYAFIFGKLGAPRMEVAGAAIGTLIARIFEASCILGYLFLKDKEISFRVKDLLMKTESLIGEYIKICIPVLISDGILAIGNNTVAVIIGHLGKTMVSANAITAVTQQLSTVVVQGVSQAGAIVTGQTLGTGDREQTMKQGYLFFGLGIGLGLISATFITAFKNPIIASYTGVGPETRQIASRLMLAISLIIIFQATNSIMTKGVLRGGGDTKMLMITDNIFLWVISIPLGLLAGFVFHLPAFWIYVCLKSDQIIKTFWSFLRLKSGKWIKKISTGKAGA